MHWAGEKGALSAFICQLEGALFCASYQGCLLPFWEVARHGIGNLPGWGEPSPIRLHLLQLFQAKVAQGIRKGIAQCLVPSFQVGVEGNALYLFTFQPAEVEDDGIPLVGPEVDEVSPHIIWLRILQGGIQVHDDRTLTLREDLKDKAVEGAEVPTVHLERKACPSEGGIIGVVGRSRSPLSRRDRNV